MSNVERIDTPTFEKKIKAGEMLILLDDLVLDVSSYINSHPGGKVMFERNLGRDVAKYFYGGYSLAKNFYPYTHSAAAIMVSKTLVKYRLVPTALGKSGSVSHFEASLTSRQEIVPHSVYTVTFEATSKQPGLQKHYNDINMIGCHFLVQSDDSDKKRHYTVCNCMRNEVYSDYMRIIKSFLKGEQPLA